jgi:hypothetical protein
MGVKMKTLSTVIVLANSVEEPCEEAAICVLLIKTDFFCEFGGSANPASTAKT